MSVHSLPLNSIDEIFRHSLSSNELLLSNLGEFDVRSHFDSEFQGSEASSLVPFFSKEKLGTIPNGSLVVYRGLVYDIYDPEFYTAAYRNRKTGESLLAMYRDSLPQHVLDQEGNGNDDDETDGIILERLAVLCCAIPGESDWLKEHNKVSSAAQTDSASSKKRQLQEEEDDFEVHEMVTDSPSLKKVTCSSFEDVKPAAIPAQSPVYACESLVNPSLIKFYHQMEEIRLNDMVECLCVYTADPHLDTSCSASSVDEMWDEGVRYPPASVAPRLHCITYRKLGSSFPFYHSPGSDSKLVLTARLADNGAFRALASGSSAELSLTSQLSNKQSLRTAREQVLSLLADVLHGDRLAAEYLLLTLLSRRLNSNGDTVENDGGVLVGMIALQLTCLSKADGATVVHDVQAALAQVVPRVVRVAADSTTLNAVTVSYQPTRDYDTNSMTVSPLRMGVGSVLLVDASKEQQVQQPQLNSGDGGLHAVGVALNAVGAKSARAIRSIVAEQKLVVSCGYSDVILRTESPCVVFTAGMQATQQFGDESEIITLPLQAASTAMNEDEDEEDLVVGLSEAQLNTLRQWWCTVRLLDTTMDENMLKHVENDFVRARQQSEGSITGVDFHRWVNLVRLMAASYGDSEIKVEHWDKMREIESYRVQRVSVASCLTSTIATGAGPTVNSGAANRIQFSPNSVATNCGIQM